MKISPFQLHGLRFATAGLGSLLLLGVVGCKSSSASSGAAPIVSGADNTHVADNAAAEDGNLAPVINQGGGQPTQVLGHSASYTPQQQSASYPQQQTTVYPQQNAAPIERSAPSAAAPDQNYSYNADNQSDEQAGEDALAASDIQADQPPPPLPEYDQPPAPEPDYLWTPGYWAYVPTGYYWTPGVWCPPPYYGALWTPPYWGFYGGRYRFHHGYWGPHVGFYGGVDYGFGYIGIGYFGGYWQDRHFYYNRSVTNVNVTIIRNVYTRDVVYNNVRYGRGIQNRVSYNGGRGGLNIAPRPQEMVALRETHTPALREQVQVRTQAAGNRSQFFAQNHGRPAQSALARPIAVSHQIGEAPRAVQQEQQRSAEIQQRNMQGQHTQPLPGRGPEQQPGQRGAEQQRGLQQPVLQHGPELQRGPVLPPGQQPEQRGVQPQPGPQPQHTQPFQPRGAEPTLGQPQRGAESQRSPVLQQREQPSTQQQRPVQQQTQPGPVNRPAPVERPQPTAQPQPAPRPTPTQQQMQQPRPEQQQRPQMQPRPEQQQRPEPQPRPEPQSRPAPQAAPRPAPAPRPARPEVRPPV